MEIISKAGRRWVRRVLIVTFGLILSLLVLLALPIYFFDDDDYRAALIWSADYFLDSQLEINGTFSVNLGDDLHLSAKDVHLKAHDSSYALSVDKLDARQQFGSYLKTGTMWFNSVSLVNIKLDISDTAGDAESVFNDFSFPPIVMEQLSIDGLMLRYKDSDQLSQTFELRDLLLDDEGNQGPIKLNATGQLNSQVLSIKGALGSLAQLRDTENPYPVNLRLRSGSLDANLDGVVGNLLHKKNARFDVDLNVADITELSTMLNRTLPAMGPVKASATFTGNTSKLNFDEIKLNVGSLDNPSLKASGSVYSTLSSGRLDESRAELTFDVSTAKLIQMFGKTSGVEGLGKLQGHLQASLLDEHWRFNTIKIDSTNTDLYQLHLAGDHSSLRTKIEVADPAAFGSLLGDELTGIARYKTLLPTLGPVRASATFSGNSNKLNFDEIKLNLGSRDNPILKASGSGHSTLSSGSLGDTLLDLKFDVATVKLIQMFNFTSSGDSLGKLQGQLRVSAVDERWHIKTIKIDSTNTDLFQLHLVGDHAGLQSKLAVPDPAALGSRVGVDLTGVAPYRTMGVLSVKEDLLNYTGRSHIGKTETNVDLSISLANEKPHVRGKITVPVLYLTDLGLSLRLLGEDDPLSKPNTDTLKSAPTETSDVATPHKKQSEPSLLFNREPFNFTLLQSFNLELAVLFEQIEGVDFSVEQLDAQIKLNDGLLQIPPAKLTFEGGVAELAFDMNSRDTPQFRLKVTANDLVLGRLIAQLQQEVPVEGYANLSLDIDSKGHSEHELASHLNGKLSLRLENARIPKKYIEFLSVDVLGWAFRAATFSDKYSPVDCIMMGFDIEQGVAKSKLMFADGANLTIQGRTTLDFGQETIDMVLLPKAKNSIFSNISAVNIKGPLRNPNVSDLSADTAATNIGATVMIPGVAIPVYLFDKLRKRLGSSSSASKGCATFIEQQKAKENEAKQE